MEPSLSYVYVLTYAIESGFLLSERDIFSCSIRCPHLRLDRGFRFLGAVLVALDDICNHRTQEERMLSVAKLVRKSRVGKDAQ